MKMYKKSLKVIVIGAGYFGRFHAIQASKNPLEELIGIFDIDVKKAQKLAKELKVDVYHHLEAVFTKADAVIIASPAETHFHLSKKALMADCHVLVEKPIADSLAHGKELQLQAEKAQKILQVGHLLRYSAEYEIISQLMPQPLYIEATRIAPYKQRGTDVSVILDLMIHDIDFIVSLVSSPIMNIDAMGAAVSSSHEDIANAHIRFQNGCTASITASRISLKTERKMRLFGQNGYISADFSQNHLTFINKEKGLPLPATGGFKRQTLTWKNHDNLEREHTAFAYSCLNGIPPIVDAQAGLRALDTALRVGESIAHSQELAHKSGLLH